MFRALPLLVALALFGCDSPSPQFGTVEPTEVTIGEMRFAVRQSGASAEAIRISSTARPAHKETVLKGLIAAQAATGCSVLPGAWSGDTAIVRAALSCGQAPVSRPAFDCTVVAEWKIEALGQTVQEIECNLVAG